MAQDPKPSRLVRRQINHQGLIACEQRLNPFGLQRPWITKLRIGRELRRYLCIEAVEALRDIREGGAQRRLLVRSALGRRAACGFNKSAIETAPLLDHV